MPATDDLDRSFPPESRRYIFDQLIPYIGNKRKLLGLIARSLRHTAPSPGSVFLDLFAGSGAVSRLAKTLGYKVVSNDWEPYAEAINGCYIANNRPPEFKRFGGYEKVIEILNSLPPRVDWVARHLCPLDDENCDPDVERMFFMRKNGMRIDAVRRRVYEWRKAGFITEREQNCLLAPLLYQTCYTSNTSGVFKGFHNGWGGRTKTALYRIAADLKLAPAVFFDNHKENEVLRGDARKIVGQLSGRRIDAAYLDPPYNQHPYGSNYHVLNSVALWDKPQTGRTITPGTKSAIRLDWRTERRSPYNSAQTAAAEYKELINSIDARHILTSYSTDGLIPLEKMFAANVARGRVRLEMMPYKRYRVSSQRFSPKPMNVEFVAALDTRRRADVSVEELCAAVKNKEKEILAARQISHKRSSRYEFRSTASAGIQNRQTA